LIDITGIECSIEDPLIAFVGRMVYQKGIDIIVDTIPDLIETGVSFVVEGTGEYYYEEKVKELQQSYPSKIFTFVGFDESLAHKIYAGADALLVPSKYEPCGLSQIIAMRYGTIPICRKTGGLADTVEDEVTGFLFNEYSAEALKVGVHRFLDIYSDKAKLNHMIYNAMSRDFSWTKSCKEYIKLY